MTRTAQQIAAVTADDVPALFRDFEQDLEKLREFLRTAPERIAAFERWARETLEWIAWWEWAYRELQQLFDAFLAKVREIVQRVQQVVSDAVTPVVMRHDIQLWQEVYRRAQSIAESTERRDFPHMDYQGKAASSHWNGIFAQAYRSQVEPQHVAAERVAAVAKDTAGSLAKVFAASVAVYTAWAALAYQVVMLFSYGRRQWLSQGRKEWRTLLWLFMQAVTAESLARTISNDEGKALTTVANGRPGLGERDVAWPNPFRDPEFARARVAPDGTVMLEGGAPTMWPR